MQNFVQDDSCVVWHHLTTEAVCARLQTNLSGLSQREAVERLAKHGPNRLPEAARPSAILRLLRHFQNVMIYVLIASSAITAFLGHWVDTGTQ